MYAASSAKYLVVVPSKEVGIWPISVDGWNVNLHTMEGIVAPAVVVVDLQPCTYLKP